MRRTDMIHTATKENEMETQSYTEDQANAYTDSEATDEALLLLTRKLHRLHPAAYTDLMARLPEGAKTALRFAENRAERVRDQDGRNGTAHRYLTDDEAYGTTDEE
jgi:hypothetical protein